VNPEDYIADLDAELAEGGHSIKLLRMDAGAMAQEVTCQALVRGYAAHELVGGITVKDSRVILSPTEIISASWKSFVLPEGKMSAQDPSVPVKGNTALIDGKVRNVEAAGGIYVAGQLVRIEMRVLG
jgi:hypothetical protein